MVRLSRARRLGGVGAQARRRVAVPRSLHRLVARGDRHPAGDARGRDRGRDLYDRPPSVLKKWNDGRVALLGDAVHAMMPNLGQGGRQAIEDAAVLAEEIGATSRSDLADALQRYRNRWPRARRRCRASRFARTLSSRASTRRRRYEGRRSPGREPELRRRHAAAPADPADLLLRAVQLPVLAGATSASRSSRSATSCSRPPCSAPASSSTACSAASLRRGEAIGAIDGASEGSEGILATLQQLFESFSGMMILLRMCFGAGAGAVCGRDWARPRVLVGRCCEVWVSCDLHAA